MKLASLFLFAGLLLTGCSSSGGDADGPAQAGGGQIQNPGGKPKTPEDAQRAAQMREQGQAMSAQQSANAKAMQEAMRKTGGK